MLFVRKRSPSSALRAGVGSTPWKYLWSFAATNGAHAGWSTAALTTSS